MIVDMIRHIGDYRSLDNRSIVMFINCLSKLKNYHDSIPELIEFIKSETLELSDIIILTRSLRRTEADHQGHINEFLRLGKYMILKDRQNIDESEILLFEKLFS